MGHVLFTLPSAATSTAAWNLVDTQGLLRGEWYHSLVVAWVSPLSDVGTLKSVLRKRQELIVRDPSLPLIRVRLWVSQSPPSRGLNHCTYNFLRFCDFKWLMEIYLDTRSQTFPSQIPYMPLKIVENPKELLCMWVILIAIDIYNITN